MKKHLLFGLLACVVLLLSACAGQRNETAVTVLIEDGEHYTVDMALVSLEPGNYASFYIRTDPDYAVTAADYDGNYTLTRTRSISISGLSDVIVAFMLVYFMLALSMCAISDTFRSE